MRVNVCPIFQKEEDTKGKLVADPIIQQFLDSILDCNRGMLLGVRMCRFFNNISHRSGVIPALNMLFKVLVGRVTVDPNQPPLLTQFIQLAQQQDKDNAPSVIKAYVGSLVLLQVKGLLLLLNAFKVYGDFNSSDQWCQEMHFRYCVCGWSVNVRLTR